MSSLPHIFIPSNRAVQQTMCAHPSGPLELFMVACNLDTDIKLDVRLSGTGYRPVLTSSSGEKKHEENKDKPAQFPFTVPLTLNAAAAAPAVKEEPRA